MAVTVHKHYFKSGREAISKLIELGVIHRKYYGPVYNQLIDLKFEGKVCKVVGYKEKNIEVPNVKFDGMPCTTSLIIQQNGKETIVDLAYFKSFNE